MEEPMVGLFIVDTIVGLWKLLGKTSRNDKRKYGLTEDEIKALELLLDSIDDKVDFDE